MTQTSTKRKKVIIASIIIVVLVVVSIGALIVCNQLNSSQIGLVTVSGKHPAVL
jgi:flagellar basal body-associated protein FliL